MSRKSVTIQLRLDGQQAKSELEEFGGVVKSTDNDFDEFSSRGQQASDEVSDSLKDVKESAGDTAEGAETLSDRFQGLESSASRIPGPIGRLITMSASLRSGLASVRNTAAGATTSLKAFRAALIATGIGALIVAVGSLIGLLTRLQSVTDAVERVTKTMGTAVQFAATRLGAFLGLNDDVNQSLGDTLEAQNRLTQMQQNLADWEIEAIPRKAELNKTIAESRAIIQDETLSLEERQEALEDAAESERDLLRLEKELAQVRVDILREEIDLADSSREEKEELARAEAALSEIEQRSANIRLRLQRDENRLRREAEREEQERREAERERFLQRREEQRQQILFMEAWRNQLDAMEGEAIDDMFEHALNSVGEISNELGDMDFSPMEQGAEASSSAFEGLEEDIGRAAVGQIALADNAEDAANRVIDTIISQIVARAIESAMKSLPFPANIAAAGGAALAARGLKSLIPSFRHGVDDFEGGMARVHRGEMITLPQGANVINNENVQRMAQQAPQIDFARALQNVQWKASSKMEMGELVFSIQKEIDTQQNLGSDVTL